MIFEEISVVSSLQKLNANDICHLLSFNLTDLSGTFKMMNFSSSQQIIPLLTIEDIKNNLSFPKN